MVKMIEDLTDQIVELEEEVEAQKQMMEELLDLSFTLQARVSALCEILVKENITDPQELQILEMDNLNTIQASIERD